MRVDALPSLALSASSITLGFTSLFLWTAGQRAFYERLWWEDFATARLGPVDIVIMRWALDGDFG